MSKDEHPINLIYDGIAEMLITKGNVRCVTCTDFVETQTVVDYGGYRYFIVEHIDTIVSISRISKEEYTHEQKEPNN